MKDFLFFLREYSIIDLIKKSPRYILSKTGIFDYRKEILAERSLAEPIMPVALRIKVNLRQANKNDLEKFKIILDSRKVKMISERFDSGKICLIALNGNELAYFGWISFEEEFEGNCEIKVTLDDHECYWYDCYTFPKYRNKGLHSFVTTEALKYSKSRGYKKVRTYVWDKNTYSRKAFKALGFVSKKEVIFIRFFFIKYHKWIDFFNLL